MSNIFASSLFPSLEPKVTDSLWFKVDKPCDDESDITKLELEHHNWLSSIVEGRDIIPIGKTAEQLTEEEGSEDEGEDEDDDTDSNEDDELDTDIIDDRDSTEEADMEAIEANADSSTWQL